MTVKQIFRTLARRSAEAFIRDGALIVRPKSAIDEKLREAIRENKNAIIEELETDAAFFDFIVDQFDGEIVPNALEEAAQGHADGALRHCVLDTPSYTEHRCEAFTMEQFSGYSSASRVMTVCKQEGRGCGICDIAYSMWRLAKLEARENEIKKRKGRSERYSRQYFNAANGED